MADFTAFLRHLLESGEARLRGQPVLQERERAESAALLAAAYAEYALDVPGPPPPFSPAAALAAAQFVAGACWFLLHRGEPPDEVAACLSLPPLASPGDHLSADLTLRFAAPLLRRARAADPQDVLTVRLAEALRRAPLSGALADLPEPPEPPADLGGHEGLLLLLAERLAERPRPAWLVGAVAPYAELVFARRGVPLPAPLGGVA